MSIAQPEETPGQRLAQARRLLSFALGKDLSQTGVASIAGVSSNAWNEWERDISKPQAGNRDKVLALFRRHGMPYITDHWLDYGVESEGFPRIVTEMIEVVPAGLPVPEDVVHSASTRAKSARSQSRKSGGRRR